MRYLIIILGLFLIPIANAATLSSDFTANYLEIATGSTLTSDGYNITIGGGTGETIIYGTLDARQSGSRSTIFTQISEGFRTHGSGAV